MKQSLVVSVATAFVALAMTGAAAQSVPPDARADVFTRRKCTDCHAITGLGVKAAADVGPDLTYAYGEVPIRYGTNLESFLANPTGVMRLMLASHLHLRPAERDSMVQVLKALYDECTAFLEDLPWDFQAGSP